MTLRNMLFGKPVVKAQLAAKDEQFERDDARLKQLEALRASMRKQLGDAMKKFIEDPAR